MDINVVEGLRDEIMSEALEDDIGLWWIIGRIKDRVPSTDVKAATLCVIAECLKRGASVGQFTQGSGTWDFHAWDLSADKIIKTIQIRWDELGRDPDLGEIAWLVIPPNRRHVR